MLVNIAVKVPLASSVFTYEYSLSDEIQVGTLVLVPFGNRKIEGVVIDNKVTEKPDFEIKEVSEVLSTELILTDKEILLYEWMSKYYHYSFGQLMIECLPKFMKRPKLNEFPKGLGEQFEFTPNPIQMNIINSLTLKLNEGFSKNFIHGVTGSGKTLIYLKLIKSCIESGKSAQFLLPEINLTPQFIDTFKKYVGAKIYSYHSSISNSDKFSIYKNLQTSDEPVLVIGVRSSIFLPINNLGLVIIDEEHDNSFKQTDRCPYNGRDVAIKKAQISECPIIMGSATPSMENFNSFYESKDYFTLRQRVSSGNFPQILTLDNRGKFEIDSNWPLLDESIEHLRKYLEKGEQVLVFINKLGFANYLQCRSCGNQFQNEDCGCGLNLRFFKSKQLLSCSHCEYKIKAPESCPKCGNIHLLPKGFGTEKVEEVLKTIFPNKVTERFDRDEIKTFTDLNNKLDRFHAGEIDILVGTQMLAKGHNFEKVNCVLILGIDAQLNFSDFRANEKTFQLVTQVAGRAGRYSPESKVIIQTMNPDNMIFDYLRKNSFDEFYKDEIEFRKISQTPPFSKMIMIYMSSSKRDKLVSSINSAAQFLHQIKNEKNLDLTILGPTSSVIEKRAKQFTWMIMLKSNNLNDMHSVVSFFHKNFKVDNSVNLKIDVDPTNLQ